MKIRKLTSYVLAGMLAASCHSGPKGHEKAIKMAQQYLTTAEIKEAQKQAEFLCSSGIKNKLDMQDVIYYWDSVLCSNKRREGFLDAEQAILDSIDGKTTPIKRNQKVVRNAIDTRIELMDLERIKKIRGYYTPEEIPYLLEKEPKIKIGFKRKPYNEITAYYGEIALAGAYRQGYQNGLKVARKLYTEI